MRNLTQLLGETKWKQEWKSWCMLCLLLFFTLYFYGKGVFCAADLNWTKEIYSLQDSTEGWEARMISERKKEERERPLNFTAWTQLRGQELMNESLGRRKAVDVIAACGNTELLFPGESVLTEGDREGCLLDEGTALELYGNRNPTGREAVFGGKTYIIRGVLKGVRDTFVIQAEKDQLLDRINAWIPKGQSRSEMKQKLSVEYGFSGTELEWRLMGETADLGNLLLPLLAGIWTAKQFRRMKRGREGWLKAMFWLAEVSCIVLSFCFVFGNLPFSRDDLPSTWSDFSFWEERIRDLKEGWREFVIVQKRSPELQTVFLFLRTMGYQFLAVLLSFCFVLKKNRNHTKDMV